MPQSRFSHAVIGMAIGLGIGAVLQFNTGAAPQSAAPQPASPQAKPAGRLAFTEPAPFDFNDHDGYVSLFDGITLKGWDGNPKFWRVEDGAIVGESTPENPSGNSYIVYRDLEAKDFTLKFEIKVEGDGGSGIQYRSKTGIPWLVPTPARRDRERRTRQSRLDDDGSAGRLLAEPRLHRAVLFREHPDAHPRVARPGCRGLRREEQEADGHDRRSQCARQQCQNERLEPVHRHRSRRHVPPHRQRPADGGDDRRRPGILQQSVRPLRHRDRGHDARFRCGHWVKKLN